MQGLILVILLWFVSIVQARHENHIQHLLEIQQSSSLKLAPDGAAATSAIYDNYVFNSDAFFETEHFRVYYHLSGIHTVNPEDLDNSLVPDYVELVGKSFEESWQFYHQENQFPEPLSDADKYVVFLRNLGEGIYGFMDINGQAGDNPNTLEIEERSYESYVVLRNFYSAEVFGEPTQALQATAAHEYFHGIQAAFNIDLELWFIEGSATSMETFVFPESEDNLQYLGSIFDHPDAPLTHSDFNTFEWVDRIYGIWIYWFYVFDRFGMKFCEQMIQSSPPFLNALALQDEVIQKDSSLAENDFSSFELFRDFSFSYLEGQDLAQSGYFYSHEVDMQSQGSWDSQVEGNQTLRGRGVDFFQLAGQSDLSLELSSSDSVVIRYSLDQDSWVDTLVENSRWQFTNRLEENISIGLYYWDSALNNLEYKLEWKPWVPSLVEAVKVRQDKNQLLLEFVEPMSQLKWNVYTLKGEQVAVRSSEGFYSLILYTDGLSSGVYWLQLDDGNHQKSMTWVVD